MKSFAQHSFAASGGYALNPSAVFQLKFGGGLTVKYFHIPRLRVAATTLAIPFPHLTLTY
jgi:hypothetical protein